MEVAAGESLVRVCRLLASLAQHADDLFQDLLNECHNVADRTQRLDERLRDGLMDRLASLDAKTASRRAYFVLYYLVESRSFLQCSNGLQLTSTESLVK